MKPAPNQKPDIDLLNQEIKRLRDQRRNIRILNSTVFSLISVAAVAVLVCMLLMPVLRIYGSSMEPTLRDGEIVVALKNSRPKTGDLIGFYFNNKILVKRVIASAGQWVNIDAEGNVTVDDEPLDEPYLQEKALGTCDIHLPYQVPDGRIFVMGDHRATSVDSRSTSVGCASEEQIVGKIVFCVWPLREFGLLK